MNNCYTLLFLSPLFAALQFLCWSGMTQLRADSLFQFVRAIKSADQEHVTQFGASIVPTERGYVIGAPLDSENGFESGALFFLNEHGTLVQKVANASSIERSNVGLTLSLTTSGDVVVGNFSYPDPGRVYIYDKNGSLRRTISSPTEVDGYFGVGLATIGDTLLVGSLLDSTGARQAGAVYAYSPGVEQPKIFLAPTPIELADLGRSITPLGGGKFVASAYTESFNGVFATGAAYIFDLNSEEVVRIPDPNPREYNYFGIGTGTLNGNVLVGVAEQEGNVATGGVAYMFDQQGNLLRQFNNPHPDVDDLFGYKVTGVGNHVVVGAPADDTTELRSGAAYVFDQQGRLVQELFDPTPGDAAGFGWVQSYGETLYVGALYDDGGPPVNGQYRDGPGAVYIYKMNLLPGDVDMNGVVNLLDFASLRTHFGDSVDARADGDLTGDLKVNIADFAQLRANFGRRQAAVPEPGVHVAAWATLLLATWVSGLPGNRRRCEWRQSQ